MFELLLTGSAQAEAIPITINATTHPYVHPNLRSVSDTYFAGTATGNGLAVIQQGGIVDGGAYTGRGMCSNVRTGSNGEIYQWGSAAAFGAAVLYTMNDRVVYTGAILATGPFDPASYIQSSADRRMINDSNWNALATNWPTVDGKLWKGFAGTAVADGAYYFGGFNHTSGFAVTDAIFKYTGLNYVLTQPGRMPYKAQGVGAVSADGDVFIYGGTEGNGRLKHMYRMKPNLTFIRLPDLPIATSYSQGVYISGHIVFLAKNPEDNTAVVIAFNIATEKYTVKTTQFTYRSGYAAYVVASAYEQFAYFIAGAVGYWSMATASNGADMTYADYILAPRINDGIFVEVILPPK